MKIVKTWKEDNKFKIQFDCSGEQWDKAFKKEYDNAIKSVKVEGFRPGKVPTEIAKKYVSDVDAAFRAIFKLDSSLYDLVNKNEDYLKVKDQLFVKPALDIIDINKDAADIRLSYSFLPTLAKDYDYKKISLYPTKPEKVTKDQIESELEKYQSQSTKVVESESKKLSKGQFAVFDFTGFLDGVEFEGGKATNFELEIGSGQFIPGFEDQMIGMEVGTEKDINVIFPENYHEKSLAGKPVVFKIKLHSIKEKVTPELNDETVKNMEIPGIETVTQLKEYIENYLLEKTKTSNKELVLKSVIKDFNEKGELTEISEDIIEYEGDAYIDQISKYYQQQGISLEQILKISNSSIKEFKEKQQPEVIKKIKTDALITYVADKEKLSVSDKEFDAECEKLAKLYGVDPEIVKQRLTANKPQIMKELLLEKVLEKLFDLNKNNKQLQEEEHNHDLECNCGHEH